MVDKEEKTKRLFKKVESLKKYWGDVCDVFALLKDRVEGNYTETPWITIAALTGALLYVLSPIDLIPDLIPLAGYLDDAAVFGIVLTFCQDDLRRYRDWRKTRANA